MFRGMHMPAHIPRRWTHPGGRENGDEIGMGMEDGELRETTKIRLPACSSSARPPYTLITPCRYSLENAVLNLSVMTDV